MSAQADVFVVFGVFFAVLASQLLMKALESLSKTFVRHSSFFMISFLFPAGHIAMIYIRLSITLANTKISHDQQLEEAFSTPNDLANIILMHL
jgi:predicted membrane protein